MSNLPLEPHAEGTVLALRAQAAARRNEIKGVRAGSLLVAVTQAPEKGKANQAILALVARALGVRKSHLVLLSGETSPQKRLLVRGLKPDELAEKLRAHLVPPGGDAP